MSDKDSNTRLLVRKAELARMLGCSVFTIDRWTRDNKIPKPIFITDGSPAQWRMATIEAWLAKRTVARRRSHGWRGAASGTAVARQAKRGRS